MLLETIYWTLENKQVFLRIIRIHWVETKTNKINCFTDYYCVCIVNLLLRGYMKREKIYSYIQEENRLNQHFFTLLNKL